MSGSLAAAFLPWVVFVVAARTGGLGLGEASVLGCASAALIAARAHRRGQAVQFEVAAVVAFGLLAGVGFGLAPVWGRLDEFSRVLGAGSLVLLTLASLVAGRPFTRQYTEPGVPSAEAAGPAFARLNRRLTAGCSAGALGVTLSFVGGALFDGPLATTIFNWLFPIALVLACTTFTQREWRLAGDGEDMEGEMLWASLAATPTIRHAAPPSVMARPLPIPSPAGDDEVAAAGGAAPGLRAGHGDLRSLPGGAGR